MGACCSNTGQAKTVTTRLEPITPQLVQFPNLSQVRIPEPFPESVLEPVPAPDSPREEEASKCQSIEPLPEPVAEPVPAPESPGVEEPPKSSLSIEFDQATCVFNEQPLGMTFETRTPLTVGTIEEGGVADRAGVKPGFTFKVIGGVPVANRQADEATNILKQGFRPLPSTAASDGFVVTFVTKPGYTRSVAFTRRPLGLHLEDALPLKVKSVDEGSNAAEHNVQPGWEIKALDGRSVKNVKPTIVFEQIKQGSSRLSA